MALNDNVWQGLYGEGLIWALACAAGLNPGKRELDVDGVDIQIGYPGRRGKRKSPLIEAQIKSWCDPKVVDGSFAYPLPVGNFNQLTGTVGEELATPRFLFLVIVPREHSSYCSITPKQTRFSHAAYWKSLMDEQEIDPESQGNKTVHVSQENLLTTSTLLTLIDGTWEEEAA